uniref:Uncharacterized protein n=1 Tax=Euplotes harpa TaxID=151035 RepID=A0A7S3J4K2_9SPIT|mmetsp:Transcript_19530/g.22726  ORF Transcript_19530/g.22726 Transcript_19530/m.22726 type:complete len:283 (+) Transcript_19530:13-861(+)
MGKKLSRAAISTDPIVTEDGEYHPNEKTRRIVGLIEAEFGKIEDRSKIKDIGKRDFSKIDISIFNRANNPVNGFYETLLKIIRQEYKNLNEYFKPNNKVQRPLLFILANDANEKNRDILIDFITEYGDELTDTLNDEKQCSILHCLAKQQTVFSAKDTKLFDLVLSKTYVVVRNNINRSFVETAIAQKSPNLEYIVQKTFVANRKMMWLITTILKAKTSLRKENMVKILKYYGNESFIRKKYAEQLRQQNEPKKKEETKKKEKVKRKEEMDKAEEAEKEEEA